ncbi:lytic transglycosylase domain-containing protein [Rhodoferax bucti]|uniref:lytic transglycosylase domain-containing protein n=1 Tax=Rhodoferax bucti TaxID=2576305 RepID=UPI0011089E8B|nr:lytic transglycosylase domain-containing protein [Rhodoferax bucti]
MQFSAILTSLALCGALMSSTLAPVHAQGRDVTRLDETILDLAQAYKNRDRKRLSAALPSMRGYVLEPWAAYWELSARLDEAGKSEIQDFLNRYNGTYQEDRLRAEWLLQLGRNRDWDTFGREYPLYRMGDDKGVRCYALWADYSTRGVEVSEALESVWWGLKDTDDACSGLASQLIKDKKLSARSAWVRARLGMENDRPRVATQAVGMLDTDYVKTVNTIYATPAKYLNDKFTALRPQTREFVSLALIRLAYLEPQDAATEVDKLRWKAQLTQEERSWIWGVIGKRAAQKLSDEAPGYFAKGQFNQMHEDHLIWATRAALRAGRWSQVADAVAAMPDSLRNDPAWVYWRARVLAQRNVEAAKMESQSLLESIAGTKGFYEMLALEELGQKIVTPPKPAPLSAEEKDQAKKNPGLTRALHAIAIGLRNEGVREWNYSTNLHNRGGLDDRALLAAADLACKAEVWDRCINTSERTKGLVDVDQRFPMPHKQAVLARSQLISLDPAYVYGLIRQESRFITDAKSGVGAAGLMQVMPATAKWTAKKIGLNDFQAHQITDRDTNIAIGTGYLKLVLDSFAGSMPMAAAAYNAGPGRPRIWRGQSGAPVLEGAIWAENVPFTETRDYVKKVLANTTLYSALITGQPQSLKARLGSVGPRDAATPEAGLDLP